MAGLFSGRPEGAEKEGEKGAENGADDGGPAKRANPALEPVEEAAAGSNGAGGSMGVSGQKGPPDVYSA